MNQKQSFEMGLIEKYGEIVPEGIASMMNDKPLLEAITQSSDIRKQIEKKRIDLSSLNPEKIVSQLDEEIRSKSREMQRKRVEELGKTKGGHAILSSIVNKVLSAYKITKLKLAREAGGEKESIKARLEKDRMKARLELLKKGGFANSMSKLLPTSVPTALSKEEHGIQGENEFNKGILAKNAGSFDNTEPLDKRKYQSSRSASQKRLKAKMPGSDLERKPRPQPQIQKSYIIGGYDQFCQAADHLCSAFIKGEGQAELDKYHRAFNESRHNLSTATLSASLWPKINIRKHLREMSLHLKELHPENAKE